MGGYNRPRNVTQSLADLLVFGPQASKSWLTQSDLQLCRVRIFVVSPDIRR